MAVKHIMVDDLIAGTVFCQPGLNVVYTTVSSPETLKELLVNCVRALEGKLYIICEPGPVRDSGNGDRVDPGPLRLVEPEEAE